MSLSAAGRRLVVSLAGASILLGACGQATTTADGHPLTCDRFVELWAPRLKEPDYIDVLEARDGYPEEILAEGFHALDEPTRRELVECLVEELAREDSLPAGTTRQEREEVEELMFLLIFHKEDLPPPEMTDLTDPVPAVTNTTPLIPPSVQEQIDKTEVPGIPSPTIRSSVPLPSIRSDG